MKDEIKEIELDHFNSIKELKQNVEIWIKEDEMYWERWFSLYDLKILLDYITTLQEENKRLNNIINELEKSIKEEIKRTEELIKDDFNHSTGSIAQVRKMLNADRENWLFILEKLKENK